MEDVSNTNININDNVTSKTNNNINNEDACGSLATIDNISVSSTSDDAHSNNSIAVVSDSKNGVVGTGEQLYQTIAQL
eukprot:Awhi_evm1s14235